MRHKQPQLPVHCPGEVRHRGVDSNDEVEFADHRRCVGEIGEEVIKTPDRQLVERREVAGAEGGAERLIEPDQREIAQRQGAKALLAGSIANLGRSQP